MTVITCSSCGLRQWIPVSGACRRCHASLGFSLVEISIFKRNNRQGKIRGPELRFGPSLRAMRLRQGRTQENVSHHARMQRSSLSRIESSKCTPSLATLARLLHALGAESVYIQVGNAQSMSEDVR